MTDPTASAGTHPAALAAVAVANSTAATVQAICVDGVRRHMHVRTHFETALPHRTQHAGRRFRIVAEHDDRLAIEFTDRGDRMLAYPEEITADTYGYPEGAHLIRAMYAEAAESLSHRIFMLEFTREWWLELSEGRGGPLDTAPQSVVLLGSRMVRAADGGRAVRLYRRAADGAPDVGMLRSAARDFVDCLH